jgi:hypothetical protein
MRPLTRGLAQHGGPPGWIEESNPAGCESTGLVIQRLVVQILLQHLFSSMQPDNFRGKYKLIYGIVYVKIPRHTKLRENSHLSMGMCT